ncbi:MAG: AAA family ATPase [Candidatus Dormibacteraeota bacterium]|nr:AAA family ATPase [Candidatus Dormibacteraeota bacterium]
MSAGKNRTAGPDADPGAAAGLPHPDRAETIEPDQVLLLPRKRKGPARVITIIAGKSGIGKSTVLSNLAAALARDRGLATAVLDLDLQFGDQGLMFDAASSPSIVDLLVNADALTPDFVLECMHQGAGVRVLGSPPSPELADLVTPQHVQSVLAHLRQMFDVVLIDTASHLSDITLEAVDSADVIVVLTTPYLAAVKNSKLILKTMSDLGIPASKLTAVLNRLEPGLKMPLDVLEANLKFPISLQLPHTPMALIESVTDGVPLVLTKPSSEWGQKISALGSLMLAEENTEGRKTARRGFLGLAR